MEKKISLKEKSQTFKQAWEFPELIVPSVKKVKSTKGRNTRQGVLYLFTFRFQFIITNCLS